MATSQVYVSLLNGIVSLKIPTFGHPSIRLHMRGLISLRLCVNAIKVSLFMQGIAALDILL